MVRRAGKERKGRGRRAIPAVLFTAGAVLLLGPGAGAGAPGAAGPGGVRPDGERPSFTLRTHEPYTLTSDDRGRIPSLTPAFGNTGPVAAPHGVVMRVTVTDARFDTGVGFPRNCYRGQYKRTLFCEFPNPVSVGAAYETAEPLPEVYGRHYAVMGSYTYAVWPLGDPPAHTEDYKAEYEQGTLPALGLKPVAIGTLNGRDGEQQDGQDGQDRQDGGDRQDSGERQRGGELRFVSHGYADKADWGIEGIKLRGRVGEYAEASIPAPTGAAQEVRIEVPEGTTFAPLTRWEREGLPSEIDYCTRDEEDGNIYCSNVNWFVTLRVRIDRRVEGAEGRISVAEPADGDTDPSNNAAPIKLEVEDGPAPIDRWVPPVSGFPVEHDIPLETAGPDDLASPPEPSAISVDGRTGAVLLAAAAAAVTLALAASRRIRRLCRIRRTRRVRSRSGTP
ncbi:hypothetical protein SSP35_03_02120 [Streptomyces sp. NBRC 110611]|nr:hypothetical protein SSP35_03_02120 [Streptomyces sp. NBRC 110611]